METKYYQEYTDGTTLRHELSKETYEMLLDEYRRVIVGGEVIQWDKEAYTVRGTDGFYYSQYIVETVKRYREVFAIATHRNGEFTVIEKIFSQRFK